jgi:hypothetical protein
MLYLITDSSKSEGALGMTGTPHPIKGGIQLTPYLTYNCLDVNSSCDADFCAYMQKRWYCAQCGTTLIVTLAEKLKHQEECIVKKHEQEIKQEMLDTRDRSLDSLRKDYQCSVCGQDFKFTTAEILKHKKSCKG